jgi:hypothetical protein
MNFEDEPYVRFYTRDTLTWKLLGWEGQSVLALMLHGQFDRAGVFDCRGREPSQAVTTVTGVPLDVTDRALRALLETETWIVRDGRIVWPEYVRAQNCRRSDRIRQQESRELRRTQAMSQQSHAVTGCHSESQTVTTCHPQLSSAHPNSAQLSSGGAGGDPPKHPSPSDSGDPWGLVPSDGNPAKKPKKRSVEIPSPLADDWSPDPAQLKALATRFSVPESRLLAIVPDFLWYWRHGDGAGKKTTARGWAQTYSNRCSTLAKNGELYSEHKALRRDAARSTFNAPRSGEGWKPNVV